MRGLGAALPAVLLLAACADRGVGFDTMNERDGELVRAEELRTEYQMEAPEAVPTKSIVAGGVSLETAARRAPGEARGMRSASAEIAGTEYALAQVRIDDHQLLVAKPAGAAAPGAEIARIAARRTGCLATGERFQVGRTTVLALDCS